MVELCDVCEKEGKEVIAVVTIKYDDKKKLDDHLCLKHFEEQEAAKKQEAIE